ncbi:ATP-binding cassette subfamily C (plasmid) [Azospirillum sp. B510]|uniref:NHLP family bacteriocin export ABC transporter peptidase/permease/ATPase subunit n=1 Tax=Azospirillum sp. (strain B510) TaxID=137722 RepID=UPI0001C4BC87|nr:NHLP family bacteriocin export ABC transporter peptidase/permease/ATPase subunit [Azospirillum sp. B510]BAI74520.1 ATP-binding cassette subfamily C [Azospirillum sp. B510]
MTDAAKEGQTGPDPIRDAGARCRGRRRRVPTILQMEATECGAASLSMLLAHHGRRVPLEVLRVACGVSRDGSKASNILRAARAYGLECKGFKRETKQLVELPTPMIVFWNFNHFLVVEGIDRKRNRVWLNDPASGPRRISVEEFDRGFTGVCLAFVKGPDFTPGGTKPALTGNLLRRLGGAEAALSFLVVSTLALVVPGLVVPAFSKVFIDSVLTQSLKGWLAPLAIGMALTAAARAILTYLQQMQLARLEVKLSLSSSSNFLWHVLRLPIEFFSQRHPGDIGNRVAANDRVAQLLSGQLATNLVGMVSIVFYAIVMASFDVALTVVGVALALLNLIVLRAVSRAREDGSQKLLKHQGQLAAASVGGIVMVETLKSSGTENDFFARWAGMQANYLNSQQQLSKWSTLLNAVPPLLESLSTAVILGLGGFRVMDGAMTIGGIVAFQSLLASFNQPIAGLVSLGGSLQTIKGDLSRLDDVLQYRTAERLKDTGAALGAMPGGAMPVQAKLSGRIEIRDVVFGYNRMEPPLVNGVSLTIEPGQRVALVGGSGSGKSTLAKLVTGLYQPWSGQILFDDLALDEIAHQRFAQSVASVDQEIFLFGGSVTENVAMWDPTIRESDVAAALRDAEMLDIIDARPGRFSAMIEEGGANFSGGQRQRLEIARALAGDPSILVLDEATSALDGLVEKRIDDNVRRRGCTCLIVAHRLSTVRDCDEIIVLEGGQIVQRGTHEEMMDVDGPYRRLIQAE